MYRHRRTIWTGLLALSLFIVTACSDGEPLAPKRAESVRVDEARLLQVSPARPLTQHSWGTMTPAGACSGGVRFEASGEGRASHIGRFDISLEWCMNPTTGAVNSGSGLVVSQGGHEVVMDLGGQAQSHFLAEHAPHLGIRVPGSGSPMGEPASASTLPPPPPATVGGPSAHRGKTGVATLAVPWPAGSPGGQGDPFPSVVRRPG